MDAKIAFGKRVAAWRAVKKKPNGRKFTQADLAKAADMHPVSVANIERGNRGKSPSLETVVKLAAALGISVEDLTTSLPRATTPEEKPAGKRSAGKRTRKGRA
jgi:transcriptional regulator with XRE-family HTH domain